MNKLINTLQAGRFIAALAVVLHHAIISIEAFVEVPPRLWSGIFDFGYLGVDFFFVLSGFIIHFAMSIKPRGAGQFAFDRLVRIMLPYWPVGIFLAVAYTLVPELSASGRDWGWISSLTLLPTASPPALSVAWTLQHELIFYFIYAVLFFANRLYSGLLLWLIAIIIVNALTTIDPPILKILLAPINLEFLAGVGVAIFVLSKRQASKLLFLSASTLCIATFVSAGAERSESYIFGFAIAFLLPVLCQAELNGTIRVPRWLIFGGAASYAIYLTHNPLLSLLSRALSKTGIGWEVAFVSAVLVCVFVGSVYHLVWERPAMKLAKAVGAEGSLRPNKVQAK